MTELSKWINDIADQVGKPQGDTFLEDVARLKEKVRLRQESTQNHARRLAEINRQRDQLIVRIANTLGISPNDFPDFFDHADSEQ